MEEIGKKMKMVLVARRSICRGVTKNEGKQRWMKWRKETERTASMVLTGESSAGEGWLHKGREEGSRRSLTSRTSFGKDALFHDSDSDLEASKLDSPGQQAGGVLILCDNTTERMALLGGQLCDNTPEKAALSCNMLWSQRPYEIDLAVVSASNEGFVPDHLTNAKTSDGQDENPWCKLLSLYSQNPHVPICKSVFTIGPNRPCNFSLKDQNTSVILCKIKHAQGY
ncbi:hypothetical protein NE237_019747 [Protea cynaroides]|uniref:Uncharacterized protein n=1 Tax=Protea cynaroides TaxID=273540 RepID=A0A9Q0K1Z0_9MAGN|nr:hypothetical protein NE237_019747 [Protea cynaroides]